MYKTAPLLAILFFRLLDYKMAVRFESVPPGSS
jgi:hypothetical protein